MSSFTLSNSPERIRYSATQRSRRFKGKSALGKRLQIVSGWFVRQFENEYNPLHIHTGSRLSCVGYLKLPEGIEEEWEEDYKDHHPSNGHIQFASGTPFESAV